MELPERKPNRLYNYDYCQNGCYFVTVCTQDRRKILSDIVGDGFPVPKPAGIIAEKHILQIPKKYPSVSIDKYTIMPDHIHILLRLDGGTGDPSPTIGTVVGWYKYQVTKQYHLQISATDEKLFQRSYYDHVVRNQCDYDEIWEYIENNPRKWILERE